MGRLDLTTLRIRHAKVADLPALRALETEAFAESERFAPRTWRYLVTRSPSCLALVIPDDARLLAAVVWLAPRRQRVARLYSLAVHPEARGRGLARALLAASLPALPGRCTLLSLEVRDDNASALSLYAALGFVQVARLPNYYAPGVHGLRMRADRSAVTAALASVPLPVRLPAPSAQSECAHAQRVDDHPAGRGRIAGMSSRPSSATATASGARDAASTQCMEKR